MVSESDATSAFISWDEYTGLEATEFSQYIITVTDKYNTTGTAQWTIRSVPLSLSFRNNFNHQT